MPWPKLPPRAAYLTLNNPRNRNSLSLSVLRDLRDQLHKCNTSPHDGQLYILPPFNPNLITNLEAAQSQSDPAAVDKYSWLVSAASWKKVRADLPTVLVLRSEGPVFSAGHDLKELGRLPHEEVKETFRLCAEVMSLIRRSPAPVVGVIQGLATAAGCQLALTTDLPIARRSTPFRLPGATLGLPCTSPATAVSRRLGNGFAYQMLALAEPVKAEDLPGRLVQTVPDDEGALEDRWKKVVEKLAGDTAAMPQALGKWAFWTQVGLRGGEDGGDGYERAVEWTGRVMAVHARAEDAREGMSAFAEKRVPVWRT